MKLNILAQTPILHLYYCRSLYRNVRRGTDTSHSSRVQKSVGQLILYLLLSTAIENLVVSSSRGSTYCSVNCGDLPGQW